MATVNELLAVDREDPNCPTCKAPVRLVDNKADGFCLACPTHGRLTLRYQVAADAVNAPYISVQEKARTKHQAPQAPAKKAKVK